MACEVTVASKLTALQVNKSKLEGSNVINFRRY